MVLPCCCILAVMGGDDNSRNESDQKMGKNDGKAQ